MTLSEQIDSAVEELKAVIEADSEPRECKLKLGKVTCPNLPDSNFDLEFENLLRQQFGRLIDNQSELADKTRVPANKLAGDKWNFGLPSL